MRKLLPQDWRSQLSSFWVALSVLLLSSGTVQAQVDTYVFAASSGTFTPLSGGTPVPDIQDDDALSLDLPLGFSFTFDGAVYTQVKASSNGWLTFNSGAASNNYTNELEAGPATERPLVAPYWDDMHGGAGTASYAVTGTAPNRVFTFEWLNWYRYGNNAGPALSFQVQLFETTNVVRFVYRNDPDVIMNASASIGLSGAGSGSNSFLSLSDAVANPSVSSITEYDMIASEPATGQIYQFTPPAPTACPTPRNLSAMVTATTATLSWSVTNANPGPFTVRYGPAGFNPTSGGMVLTGIIGATTTLSNLTANTAYQFYVTQNCGGTAGSSMVSSAGGFTTSPVPGAYDDCASALQVPIQYGTMCVGQTSADNSTATASTAVPSPGCAAYAGQDIWFKVTVPASGSVTIQTVAPTAGSSITDTGIAVYSGTCNALTELSCDDDGSPMSTYSLIDLTGRTAGEVLYIRAWAYGGNSTGLIAVCATSPSNCPIPAGLTATNITSTGARLGWTAGGPVGTGDTYEIEYGTQGFMLGTGSSVTGLTASNYQLSGLMANTNYCYYVRQNCGATNGSSPYAGPFCFTTLLAAPANDEPCGALPLSSAGAASGSNVGATTSRQAGIALPACTPSVAPKDVWFTLTPTGSSTTLTLTGTAAGMVRLYTTPDCNNGPFFMVTCQSSGNNNSGFSGPVSLTGLTAGQRYYLAVSGHGSADVEGAFTVSGTALSSRGRSESPALVLYPNPNNTGQLTLRLEAATAPAKATLLNALGQEVRQMALPTGTLEHTLSTRGLAAGLYTLRLQAGNDTFTRKVVIE